MATAFGSFSKHGKHIFRNSAHLQWGESTQVLGACLMLNPGAAALKNGRGPINDDEIIAGELELDETMKQLSAASFNSRQEASPELRLAVGDPFLLADKNGTRA